MCQYEEDSAPWLIARTLASVLLVFKFYSVPLGKKYIIPENKNKRKTKTRTRTKKKEVSRRRMIKFKENETRR